MTTSGNSATTTAGVTISHADRVVYPGTRLTKGDIAHYFERVAPLMIPHIHGRPLSIVRCPEGLSGQCFFQKHWEKKGGAAVNTRDVVEGESGEAAPYAVVERPADLVALVQNGMMEVHMWGARVDRLERPDRLIIDLDPGPGVSWSAVKEAALEVRELLDGVGLESWVKLSGGKGVHVAVPVQRHVDWDVMAAFARAIAQRMERDAPDRYVSKASKAIRTHRIFVDWLRNTRGATSVAPWSARAREGAPVSMPLAWAALNNVQSPGMFTIRNVLELLETRYRDPWRSMLTAAQRLSPAMAAELLG